MAKISFYSNDMEATISIPAEWEICDGCQGEGARALGGLAIHADEWSEWDQDEREDYADGFYDTMCGGCSGTGKMLIPIQNDSEGYKLWEDIQRAAYESRATGPSRKGNGMLRTWTIGKSNKNQNKGSVDMPKKIVLITGCRTATKNLHWADNSTEVGTVQRHAWVNRRGGGDSYHNKGDRQVQFANGSVSPGDKIGHLIGGIYILKKAVCGSGTALETGSFLDLTEKEVNNICKPDPYVEVPGTQPQLGLNERIENRSWNGLFERRNGWSVVIPGGNLVMASGPAGYNATVFLASHPSNNTGKTYIEIRNASPKTGKARRVAASELNYHLGRLDTVVALQKLGWNSNPYGDGDYIYNNRFTKGSDTVWVEYESKISLHDGCTLVGYVTLADLNERHSDKAKKAEYIRVAKSYDDKAFQVADEDSRRESPYGNQKAVKDHLDNADRFYEMAGTTREEQA